MNIYLQRLLNYFAHAFELEMSGLLLHEYWPSNMYVNHSRPISADPGIYGISKGKRKILIPTISVHNKIVVIDIIYSSLIYILC